MRRNTWPGVVHFRDPFTQNASYIWPHGGKPTFAELQLDRTKQSPSKESITFWISASMSRNEISSSVVYISILVPVLQIRLFLLQRRPTLCELLSVDRQRTQCHSLGGRFHLFLTTITLPFTWQNIIDKGRRCPNELRFDSVLLQQRVPVVNREEGEVLLRGAFHNRNKHYRIGTY